jgi:hypothetical protein
LEGQTLAVGVHALERLLHVAEAALHDRDLALQGHDLGVRLDQHRLPGRVALGQGALQTADVAVQLVQAALVPLDRLHRLHLGDDGAPDEGQADRRQDGGFGEAEWRLQHGPVVPSICGDGKAPINVRSPDR